VDVLLTLNPNNFTRLGEDVRQLVQLPVKAITLDLRRAISSLQVVLDKFWN
jgi:hypothetical protein